MSFNIDGSMERISAKAEGIANLIKDYNPDIVFIAEFSELYPEVLDTLLKETYPYTTYKSQVYYSHYFYSKYPVVEHNIVSLNENQDFACYEGLFSFNDKIVSIYGCHLASNNYSLNKSYVTPDSIKDGRGLLTYIKDINLAYKQRGNETMIIKQKLVNKNMPVILMGDLNDIGGSIALSNLENVGLKDAWWEGGSGYGATIHKPLPYRIDHIMNNKFFKLKNIKVVDSQGLSDHDALYAEFIIEKMKSL